MRRHGFTLVELVIVILILGILAAVAAPRLSDIAGTATDNGLKQSLAVVRDAIELYAANNAGALPGADLDELTFKNDLAPFIRKFPDTHAGFSDIFMLDYGLPLSTQILNCEGWIYDNVSGEFRVDSDALSSDGVTNYSEF